MLNIGDYSPYAARYDEMAKDDGGMLARFIVNPCIFSLLGDVQGRSVADVCCGQGYLAHILARSRARVVGIDVSAELLMLAKQRSAGLAAEFVQADVARPLPLARRFHVAICTLALMDVYAYQAAIRNIGAILLDGGQLIASLVHSSHFRDDDYFDTEKPRLHMGLAQRGINVRYWQRPLEDYVSALVAAGFCINQIKEPRPSPAAVARYPDQLAGRDMRPSFLVLQAIKQGKDAGRY
jgi:2-polyprenyl-3-methyl-5-hydroxy-6-metoxy-1,4-benzoquinol methylase